MKRKSISRVLSVLLTFAFTIGASSSVFAASNERSSTIVDQDRENEILQRYQAEISLVEQNYNVMINHIDQTTLDLIKQETIFYKGIMPSEKVLDFPVDCNTLTGSVNL